MSTATLQRPPASRATARKRVRVRNERFALAALLGPSLVLMGIFVVTPVVYAVYLSFTNTTLLGFGARNPQFTGLDNYSNLLGNSDFLGSLGTTGVFILFSTIIGQTVFGMNAALLLRQT